MPSLIPALLFLCLLPQILSHLLPHSLHQNSRRAQPCGDFCRFRLCNFNGDFVLKDKSSFVLLSGPGGTQRPVICAEDGSLGRVLQTAQARVFYPIGNMGEGNLVNISQWRPAGMSPKLNMGFIRAYGIPSPVEGGRDFLPQSTVGNMDPTGNQWEFVHDRCMVLPIRKYQKVKRGFKNVGMVETNKWNDCVAFRTTAPRLHVELTWDSRDRLSMEVVEPDGDVISLNNTRTEAGKLNESGTDSYCEMNPSLRKENVVYLPGGAIENGVYKVRVKYFERCDYGRANWKLRVLVDGMERSVVSGEAGKGGNGRVLKRLRFKYSGM